MYKAKLKTFPQSKPQN